MLFLLVLHIFLGGLFIALGIPLAQRRVKPNGLYGFRTPRTLRNRSVWYEANAYAGRWLIGLGIVIVVVAIVLAMLPGMNEKGYAVAMMAVIIVGLGILVVACFRFLAQLPDGRT